VRVIFAPAAEADLLEISKDIRRESQARAETFIDEIVDHCYTLTDMPRRHPLVPRYEHSGIRRCVHGKYLIFYRVREDAVEIVHILYGGMDYESMLFPPE